MTRRVSKLSVLTLGVLLLSTAVRAQDDDDLDLGDDVSEPAPAEDTAAEADGEPADAEPAADVAEEPAPEAEVEAEPPEPAAGVVIRAYAGAGATSRTFVRPIPGGTQRLPASFVPAVEVGLGVLVWPEESLSLQVDLHFQSAVGFTVTQVPPFAYREDVSVRSERGELSAGPSFRLGSSPQAPRVIVPIGIQFRTLWPSMHGLMVPNELVVPGYTLLGPHVRVELAAVLAGPLSLRLGPEVQWIISIDEALRATGLEKIGAAIGGEATLQLALGRSWEVALHYRESHAFVSGIRASFEDVERYMTARIQGLF